jgi:hypothetical protein
MTTCWDFVWACGLTSVCKLFLNIMDIRLSDTDCYGIITNAGFQGRFTTSVSQSNNGAQGYISPDRVNDAGERGLAPHSPSAIQGVSGRCLSRLSEPLVIHFLHHGQRVQIRDGWIFGNPAPAPPYPKDRYRESDPGTETPHNPKIP